MHQQYEAVFWNSVKVHLSVVLGVVCACTYALQLCLGPPRRLISPDTWLVKNPLEAEVKSDDEKHTKAKV